MSCVVPGEVVDQEPGHTGQWYETGRNSGNNEKYYPALQRLDSIGWYQC